MRILYRPTGGREFDFLVQGARREGSRFLYAPDGELRGSARLAGGDILIRELTLTREGGINGLTLRAVALGPIRAQILADLREHPDLLAQPQDEPIPASVTPRVRTPQPSPRMKLETVLDQLRRRAPQRGKRDDGFYQLVALAYVLTWWKHHRDPVATLTERLREGSDLHRELREETVGNWVRRARRHGWLTAAKHGKAGADFGPRWQQETTPRKGGQ